MICSEIEKSEEFDFLFFYEIFCCVPHISLFVTVYILFIVSILYRNNSTNFIIFQREMVNVQEWLKGVWVQIKQEMGPEGLERMQKMINVLWYLFIIIYSSLSIFYYNKNYFNKKEINSLAFFLICLFILCSGDEEVVFQHLKQRPYLYSYITCI